MKSPVKTGKSEYVEKRSRFLGLAVPVESEEEARAVIASMKKEHHDARHNCWCYVIGDKIQRYSDDGEPQGTAGLPMLEVLRKEGVTNAVCVVTRYFGGILLGAGGLLRAYTKAAKDALSDAEPEEIISLQTLEFDCDYSELENFKLAVARYSGTVEDISYGERVRLRIKMPETEEFSKKYLWKK